MATFGSWNTAPHRPFVAASSIVNANGVPARLPPILWLWSHHRCDGRTSGRGRRREYAGSTERRLGLKYRGHCDRDCVVLVVADRTAEQHWPGLPRSVAAAFE